MLHDAWAEVVSRWGKAGVRLSEDDVRRRDATRAATRGRGLAARQRNDERAKQLWQGGLVRPHRITMWLDARGLDGPEVDRACGTEEPAVDMWEAGRLYPTWEQLCALADLCSVHPVMFCSDGPTLRPGDTSMRYHVPRSELEYMARVVYEYPRDVVAETVG